MAKKKVKRNRDSKDLNNNYTLVDPKLLVEFDGTVEEFLSKITHLKPGYLKKGQGRNVVHLWWETKDSWFMNWGTQKAGKNGQHKFDGDNGWYIAPDMPGILKFWMREEGYKMYFRSK